MNKNRHQQIIEQDYAERYPLFGEILLGITDIPQMPVDLEMYDRALTMREARREARNVYEVWLLPQNDRRRSMQTETRLPCSEPGVIESFFPEWPDTEDFNGEASTEFQVEVIAAEIDVALAKQACHACPMRLQCLAKTLLDDAPRVRRGEQDLVHGVAGGWGPAARVTIINRLEELRRQVA